MSWDWRLLPDDRNPGTVLVTALAAVYSLGLLWSGWDWFSFDLINKHELVFHSLSARLIECGRLLDLRCVGSAVVSQGDHPFLPVAGFTLFKALTGPLIPAGLQPLRVFYFFCFALILVLAWRLAWRYAARRRALSGLLALLLAGSSPLLFQTLFEGQDPEDLVANVFLLLCLDAWLSYRRSLTRRGTPRTRPRAMLVSLLVACCLLSKYNVGVFVGFSILLDLAIGVVLLGGHRLRGLRLPYLAGPLLLAGLAWLWAPGVLDQISAYLSKRLSSGSAGHLDRLYYLRALLVATGPDLPVVGGVWKHKYATDLRLLTHWGQGALALICLGIGCGRQIVALTRGALPEGTGRLALPLVYAPVNLVFFSLSSYRLPTALISTVPVLWMLVAVEASRLCEVKPNPLATGRAGWRTRATTGTLVAMLLCSLCLQACGISAELRRFVGTGRPGGSDLGRLSTTSNRVVERIRLQAIGTACRRVLVSEQGVTFFEEYFSKLLELRLTIPARGFSFVGPKRIAALLRRRPPRLLQVQISHRRPSPASGGGQPLPGTVYSVAWRGRSYEIVVRCLSGDEVSALRGLADDQESGRQTGPAVPPATGRPTD